jgi:cyclic pyranopterin phosphate synthase
MKMADIGHKDVTTREAVVEGKIYLKPSVILAIKKKQIPKGDVLEAAKLAGILATKKTPLLVPLCHPIPIEYVELKFSLSKNHIKVSAMVKGRAKTGVEMEALTAASIACLTIYDMCKALDKEMIISDIKLIKKTGGKGQDYVRE